MSFDAFRDKSSLNSEEYVFVKYELDSTESVKKAAWDLAIGQSVGNPNVRNEWETDQLFENHSCLITMVDEENKLAEIAFPVVNTNWKEDGISHLLCQIMGGQTDIDHIIKSRAIDIEIPNSVSDFFFGPQFGFKGYRDYLGQYDKPLFGGIVKPKTGISVQVLLEMVKQMVEGGVDFIKEDEILFFKNAEHCYELCEKLLLSKDLRITMEQKTKQYYEEHILPRASILKMIERSFNKSII